MTNEVVQLAEEGVSVEQKRTKIWRHPDRQKIEALLRRAKTPYWIALWLEEQYPTDEEDVEPDEAAANEKLLLTPELIEDYREKFMPEASPGVDIVLDEIDDVIGRRFPGSVRGKEFELELLDMATGVAQHILAQALEQDAKLNMGVSETTLQAHSTMMGTIQQSVGLKQVLGVPGYEPPIEQHHHTVEQTNKNLNIHLHGQRNAQTGELEAVDKDRVSAVLQLLSADPEKADAAIEATARPTTPDEDLPAG